MGRFRGFLSFREYSDSNWRQLVTSLRDELTAEEIREAQTVYTKLSMISMNLNATISETSRKEDKNLYSLMFDFINLEFSLTEPVRYEISVRKEVDSLVGKVAKIARIELR